MKYGIIPIESADMPEFGEAPNDHLVTEDLLERLLRGEILRVPTNGPGVVYLKFKEGSRGG